MSKMVTRPKVQEKCIYKKKKRKYTSNPHYIPHINTTPNKMSYTNSPPKYDYSHIPKLLPLFVTSDKG